MDAAWQARAEEIIGHRFSAPELLEEALTHPSFAVEHPGARPYDRMEFLGDAVLGFIVADVLYRSFGEVSEGELTRRKHFAVNGKTLAASAAERGIGELLRLGVGAESSGERARASVLENALEALVGALYLDGGLEAARAFVLSALGEVLGGESAAIADTKGALQAWTQAHGQGLPLYRVVSTEGPDHQREFTIEVLVEGVVVASGQAGSKQAAAKIAAARALERLQGRSG